MLEAELIERVISLTGRRSDEGRTGKCFSYGPAGRSTDRVDFACGAPSPGE